MSKQAKFHIAMWTLIVFMVGLMYYVLNQASIGRQVHQVTMLMIAVNENKNAMEQLTDIIDDEKRYGNEFDSQTLAISEQRGMTRAYLHRDCRQLVLYDRVVQELKLKPEMEAIEYCKKNFDVGLGRFE